MFLLIWGHVRQPGIKHVFCRVRATLFSFWARASFFVFLSSSLCACVVLLGHQICILFLGSLSVS
jgi:hypothetical protein